MTLRNELFSEIGKIPVINSHSHILPEQQRISEHFDVSCFFREPYNKSDLIASGMPEPELSRALDCSTDLAGRWSLIEPYWNCTRFTGYAMCIREALADLCGVDELTADSVVAASQTISNRLKPGYYQQLLREKCNIRISVMNMGWTASKRARAWERSDLIEVDRDFFVPLPRLNRFSSIRSPLQFQEINRLYDSDIRTLDDLIRLIEKLCQDWKQAAVAGVKMSHANHRALDFQPRSRGDAEKVFDKLISGVEVDLDSDEGRVLEDYLVFECCRAAAEMNLAIQFHTGMRAGNNRRLDSASPNHLTPLLKSLPAARFDLSHSGFPHFREAGILAKTFANVYLNLAWVHIISPVAVRSGLKEWLQSVPRNKIVGFGDDLQHAELVYGHLKIARWNIASALAELVDEGGLNQSSAIETARLLFYENPKQLYQFDDSIQAPSVPERKVDASVRS